MLNIAVGLFCAIVGWWTLGKAVVAHNDGSPFALWVALAIPNFVMGALNLWIGFGGSLT